MTETEMSSLSGTGKKALITGVSGQDGSYLAEQLLKLGWDVHGVVRQPGILRHETSVAGVTIHEGDLTDVRGVRNIVASVRPDAIFNLGGISSVGYSWKFPYETAIVSGAAAIALMEAALDIQEQTSREVRYFQASSSEIFGNSSSLPQTEKTAITPSSPYGVAKAMAHQSVAMYRSRGLFATTGILYNHESVRRPPSFVTRRISLGVAAIALGMRDRLLLGNLDSKRDFGWAPDYVDAMARILQAKEANDYIVASGSSRSVRDFVSASFNAAGLDDGLGKVDLDPRFSRPSDAPEMRGDPSRLLTELGWRATTTFEDIAARMVAHDLALLDAEGPSILPQD